MTAADQHPDECQLCGVTGLSPDQRVDHGVRGHHSQPMVTCPQRVRKHVEHYQLDLLLPRPRQVRRLLAEC